MDIDKIINTIREQRIDVSKLPAPTGGGGGTNALTAQAKVRTWGTSLRSLIGGDYAAAKKDYYDPQRGLTDDELKNRPTFAQFRRQQADKILANKKPLPHHKAYKNAFGESFLKEFGLPPGAPGLGGGFGGTGALIEKPKTRTLGAILRDPTGKKGAREFHNDPQNYLTDADYKNRNKNLPPKKERKPYKEEMSLGAGGIAGTVEASNYDPNFTPPVGKRKKKPTILARGKFPGLRKRWSTGKV